MSETTPVILYQTDKLMLVFHQSAASDSHRHIRRNLNNVVPGHTVIVTVHPTAALVPTRRAALMALDPSHFFVVDGEEFFVDAIVTPSGTGITIV